MENASKALIMAAGVLIGVLIISLAVYLFADFGSTSAEINRQNEQQKIVQFNSQFTSYEDEEGETWTIYDVITVTGYARENNKYYKDSIYDQVIVKFKNEELTSYQDDSSYESKIKHLIKNDQNSISSINNNRLPTYKCVINGYHENGKVKEIKFYQ